MHIPSTRPRTRSYRAWFAAVAAVFVVLVGMPAAAAPADDAAADLSTAMRETLAANPGSIRLDDRTVELEPGVTITYPGPDAANAASLRPPCPYQNFCIYEHVNFGGAALGFRRCDRYGLANYHFWSTSQHRMLPWHDQASSWHNNNSGGVAGHLEYGWGGVTRAPVGWNAHLRSPYNDRATILRNCW